MSLSRTFEIYISIYLAERYREPVALLNIS